MPYIAPTGADKGEVVSENDSLSDVVRNRGLFMRFLVAASATSLACVFSNPGEVLKTRIQLQGELMAKGEGSRAYKGTWDGIVKTIKYEGVRGFQKGLGPGIAYQVRGIYFSLGGAGGSQCAGVSYAVATIKWLVLFPNPFE